MKQDYPGLALHACMALFPHLPLYPIPDNAARADALDLKQIPAHPPPQTTPPPTTPSAASGAPPVQVVQEVQEVQACAEPRAPVDVTQRGITLAYLHQLVASGEVQAEWTIQEVRRDSGAGGLRVCWGGGGDAQRGREKSGLRKVTGRNDGEMGPSPCEEGG